MEARVSGYAPVVVHEHAADLHQAVQNAGGKLARALDSAIARQVKIKWQGRVPQGPDATASALDDPFLWLALLAGATSFTMAPGLNRLCPSTTTCCPAFSPVITANPPSVCNNWIGCTVSGC